MERKATLGQRLRQVMEERGLSYTACGRLLNLPAQTVNRYALEQREPKAQAAVEMALRLEVDPLWLMGYEPAPAVRTLPVYEGPEGETPVETLSLAPPEEGDWRLVRVTEEGSGLRAGDLLLLRRQDTAGSGQLAAVRVGEEPAALCRLTRQGELTILQPLAPGGQPRILTSEDFASGTAQVLGVAVRLVREL